jgi:ABC-type uncharacterized transport system permease subunit
MALLWLRLAVFLYGIAALAVLPAALYDRPRWRHIALPAALAGAFFHFVSITETLYAAHRALPVDTHETLSLLGLILAAGFLVLAARYKTVAFGIFLLPIAVLLTIVPAFHPGHETLAYPFIRTGWLMLHIALLLVAYAALFLSLIASVLYLVQERRLKQKRVPRSVSGKYAARIHAWLPPLETLDQIALNSLRFGLPCMTAGLLIGSALALETTGPAFFADPKVLLSIAMWVAYVLMIFIRRHSGLRGRRAVYLSSFVFLVVLAVWAANSLSTVHSFRTP